MKAGMGMSASSTGGRAGFPPFPDSAAGAFAFKPSRFGRPAGVPQVRPAHPEGGQTTSAGLSGGG